MQPLKLIVEDQFWGEYDIINEVQEGKPRQIKLRGPFMQAEKVNLNKRKYPYECMMKEANRFNEEWISTGRALGELEHPDYSYINSERAAQRIISLKEDNKTWIGESIILCSDPEYNIKGTPLGDITASLIQYGTKLGQSTRGVGRLGEANTVMDYKLSTVDIVSDPSIGDFVDGILENKDFMVDTHGIVCEMSYNRLENQIQTLPKHEKAEYIGKAIKEFLQHITQR